MRIAITAIALAGCVSSAPFRPARQASVAPQAALYKAAVRVLAERGLSAATNDPDAGLVVSDWELEKLMGTQVRRRWRVAVDDGSVVVDSDCQRLADGLVQTSWEPCSAEREERTAAAAELAGDVRTTAEATR